MAFSPDRVKPNRLLQHEADLKRLGVEHPYMLGSTARGEATNDSDVDLIFDKTDIMTRDSPQKTLREAIEASAIRVF
jgi:predicted nucleotidyltransferase